MNISQQTSYQFWIGLNVKFMPINIITRHAAIVYYPLGISVHTVCTLTLIKDALCVAHYGGWKEII